MQCHDMDRRSDAELVIAARQGDVDAFTALVERYRHAGAAARVRDRGRRGRGCGAGCVRQGVSQSRRRSGTDAAFRPWLFTIVANEARNRRRSMSAAHASSSSRSATNRSRSAPRPTTSRSQHDQRRRLVDAVAALPDRHREVVALRFFAGLSESETAEVLSCPLGTVKSRLSRGARPPAGRDSARR